MGAERFFSEHPWEAGQTRPGSGCLPEGRERGVAGPRAAIFPSACGPAASGAYSPDDPRPSRGATRSNRARVGGESLGAPPYSGVAALALCSQVALLSAFDAGRAHAAIDGLEAVFADGFEYGNECAWAIPATCEQGLVTASQVALEEGSQFELAVHLTRAPSSPPLEVTATIVDADGVATVSGPLTFAPGNFGVDQSFTVTGLEDIDLDDPSGSAQVVLSVTSGQGSTPPEGVPDLAVPLQVTDDDCAGDRPQLGGTARPS